MGGGPDAPGYRSTCPAQIPATPRPSLQQDGHRSPSASGTGAFAEEAAVVSKRVPGGCRGARQPRPLPEKLRCSPGPSLPSPPSLTRLTLTRALPWRLRGRGTRRGPVAGGEGTRPGSAAFFSFPPCSPLCYVSVTLRCEKTTTNKPNTRNTNNQKITFTSEAPGPPSGAAEVGQRVGSGAR